METEETKLYLTVDEVKKITRLSNDTIRKNIRNGNLKAYKLGVRYLIKPQDLKIFIEKDIKSDNRSI